MVKELNLAPIARLVNFALQEGAMGIGPVKAIPKALKQAGLTE
jgi:acetyl-CoA acyltransferase